MDFDKLFSIESDDKNINKLYKHNNITTENINIPKKSMSLEDDLSLPEPPSFDDSDYGSSSSGGGSYDSGGYGGGYDSGGYGGDYSSSYDYGYGSDEDKEPADNNMSQNPLALVNGYRKLYDNFNELSEAISVSIERFKSSATVSKTVEIVRLNELKEETVQALKCIHIQPISESLLIFGMLTRQFNNIVKSICNEDIQK